MKTLKPKLISQTSAQEAEIQTQIAADPDDCELTDARQRKQNLLPAPSRS